MDDERLLSIWQNYPPHPLQEQEPQGDRKWIDKFPRLQVRSGERAETRLLGEASLDDSQRTRWRQFGDMVETGWPVEKGIRQDGYGVETV